MLSDAGPDGAGPAKCGAGLIAYKTACIPRLDDCAGNQVPIPGGGCKRIGVEECVPSMGGVGIKGPPDWTCKPIGVEPCAPAGGGSGIKGPPDWTCRSIGQPSCVSGWTRVAGGWCEPILPSVKCGAGTMEVIGKTTCQEVRDCGPGTWGKITIDKETIFVDGSYTGGGSDGTQAKPFTTIAAALAAAPEHGHVAVAAGTYVGDLVIDKPVTLEGRCPRMVKVKGVKEGLSVTVGGAVRVIGREVAVRGLTVSGPATGVVVDEGQATLEEMIVTETGFRGIVVRQGGQAMLEGSLIAGARDSGAYAGGSSLTIGRSVVRDTRSHPGLAGPGGAGLSAIELFGTPATITVRDTVIAGNVGTGVLVDSATAVLERTTVRAGKPHQPSGVLGRGIGVTTLKGKTPASLTLRDAEVAGNLGVGVAVVGARATVERSVVRDTRSRRSDGGYGEGIGAASTEQRASTLIVRDSVVTRNCYVGILGIDSDMTVERTLVERTREQEADGHYGVGIVAAQDKGDAKLLLRDARVSGNRYSGVSLEGQPATIERTIVEDTRNGTAPGSSLMYGIGISTASASGRPAPLNLRDSLVRRNRPYGIAVYGVAIVERTVIRDTDAGEGYGDGLGVVTYAVPSTLASPSTTVRDSLIANSAKAGLAAESGGTLTLERSIVRDTRFQPSDWGVGLWVGSHVQMVGTTAVVKDCLFLRNRSAGVKAVGSDLRLERTVIRETLPGLVASQSAYGVLASFGVRSKRAFTLKASECLVTGNRYVGLLLVGGTSTIDGSAIVDTLPDTNGAGGSGLRVDDGRAYAVSDTLTHPYGRQPGSLTLRDTLLARNRTTGVNACGSTATLERVVVAGTLPMTGSKSWGDGVEASYAARLVLRDGLVEASARANLLFEASGGTVERSVLRRGVFSIALEKDAAPTIAASNVLEGNTENRVTYGQMLKAAPPPKLPPPVQSTP